MPNRCVLRRCRRQSREYLVSDRYFAAWLSRSSQLVTLSIALAGCPFDPNSISTDAGTTPCVDGEMRATQVNCGQNGKGTLFERCDQRSVFVLTGLCDDPDACVNDDRRQGASPCGANKRGVFEEVCIVGQWEESTTCFDPDACTDGTVEDDACDAGTHALRQRACMTGQWSDWSDCIATRMLDFSTSATPVWNGDTVVLSWITEQATACTIEPGQISAVPADSGFLAVEIVASTQFRLSCSFADGQVESRVVDVVAMVPDKDWGTLAAGALHTCGVKTDGRLFCWGYGANGQLGADMSNGVRDSIVQEGTASTDWVSVSAGKAHTCGVKANGKLFCWGKNNHGQIGDGSTTERRKPTEIESGDLHWRLVSAGQEHTCGVTIDGRLFCWGNDYPGNLATQPGTSPLSPNEVGPGDDDWFTVSVGSTHACAIKSDGRLFCWGRNNHGQIGTGNRTTTYWPTQEASAENEWVQVSAGDEFTCAVKSNGSLFCWGMNGGRLGDGTGGERTVPTAEVTASHDWIGVATGRRGACGLKTDGRVFCWGAPHSITLDENPQALHFKPVLVSGGTSSFASVTVGESHACGITKNGKLICWGSSSRRLGHGAERPRSSPSEVVNAANDWKDVTADVGHVCAVKQDGRLFCWGIGALGTNFSLITHEPLQEATGATDWDSVSTAGEHACALKTDGRLFCWGSNRKGELGDGTTIDRPTPTQESSAATDWLALRTGANRTCAIKSDGRLFCWGFNEWGQLGDGSLIDSHSPTEIVAESGGFEEIALGLYHTCARKNDGSVWCWGANHTGAVGDGTTTDRLVPTREATAETDWETLAAGIGRTCAVKNDGRLSCWGLASSASGFVSEDSTFDTSPRPEATGARDWLTVTLGWRHTCGVRRGGRISCFGINSTGQLGNGTSTTSVWPVRERTAVWSWNQVTAGWGFTCARKINGRLACFGSGESGRLGLSLDPTIAPILPVD